MYRQTILIAGLLAGLSVNAHSADLDGSAIGTWQGFYAGLHFGGIDADFKNNIPTAPGPFDEASSVLGGAQAGYNFQTGRFVLGAEADISFMDIDASSVGGRFDEDFMATVRVRGGYAFNRLLAYATVGFAWTEKKTKLTAIGSAKRMEEGLVAGGGLEMKFGESWSARGEVLFVNVPKDSQTVGAIATVGGSDNVIYRAGVNFLF